MPPKIAFIGAGKVGTSLARLLFKADYEIVAIHNRTPDTAHEIASQLNATVSEHIDDSIDADLVFLTVSDDAIESVAQSLNHLNWNGKAIIHTSGAASTDKLQSLAEVGAMIGSLHPAFPFADVEFAVKNLAGATFAIETDNLQLEQWLRDMVIALNGQIIKIPTGKKPLYHAALAMSSNYTVTLFATAQHILAEFSDDTSAIDNALLTLLQATVHNISQQGIPDALTGPLIREDVTTIESHLDNIDQATLKQAYIALARLTFPLLIQRGINTDNIEKLLQDKT